MKLPRKVADLEEIDEQYRSLYSEDEAEGFVLSVSIDGMLTEEEVKGLKENKDSVLAQLAKANERNRELTDQLKKAQDAEAKRRKAKAEEEGDYKALLQQQEDNFKAQLAEKDSEIAGLTEHLVMEKIDKTATEAIAAAKGSVPVLLPHVKNACRCVKGDDGEYRVEVLEEGKRPRLSTNGNLMTISELVEEMKSSEHFGMCFEGNGATGGGATGSHGRDSSGAVVLRGEDRRDTAKYRAAKAEAEKRGVPLIMQE
jgi:hypothetical protein